MAEITLLCIIEVEGTNSSFLVDIERTKTVGHLEDTILKKEPKAFKDFGTHEFTLWKVAIPPNNNVEEVPILLDSLDKRRNSLLRPFSPRCFHAELGKLTQQDYHPSTVEEASVKQYQMQVFGRFYKDTLPYDLTATDIDTAMFGRMVDVQPTDKASRTLLDIVEPDICKSTDHWTAALIDRSGSGKPPL
ncbi:hypothetical protein BGX34_000779 [Mortierella sp. NVP85]|nr:hypothetical protein BGX34_000779 [Mortierella sp. NVP85]